MLSLKTHGRAGAQGSAPHRGGKKKKKVKLSKRKETHTCFFFLFLIENFKSYCARNYCKMLQKKKKNNFQACIIIFLFIFNYWSLKKAGKKGKHKDCSLFLIRTVQADIEMHIETRCPNTAGYSSTSLYYSFIQILSAFQRQESTRRHTTGPHCALLGLIKT